jgi:signal transduction histidine kinase/CheY-like chemotaxis protein
MSNTDLVRSTWVDEDRTRLFMQRIVQEAQRQSAQGSMTARLNTFERLQAIVQRINRVSTAAHRLQVLLYAALQDIPAAQQGAIYLSTTRDCIYVLGAMLPDEPELTGKEINAHGGYIDAVAQIQVPVAITDVQGEHLVAYPGQLTEARQVQSALVVPLVVGGRTVGVLSLENCEQTHAFTQEDLGFALLLSDYTAMVVDNAHLSASSFARTPWQEPELRSFFALIEHLSMGLLVTDGRQQYVWANAAFLEMTRFTYEQIEEGPLTAHSLLGRNLDDLIQTQSGKPHELSLLCGDGTHCPVKAILLNLDANGIQHVRGYIGIFQDLREERARERQLLHMQRLSSIGTLAASIAHRLNTPLTTVIGFAELILSREDVPDEPRSDLEAIVRQAQQAASAVRDLLSYAHLENKGRTQIDINQIIRQLTCLHKRALSASNLDISLDLEDPLPSLLGDTCQIEQVLFNLINNASQASAAVNRTGQLWIRTRRLSGEDLVRISVRDDGPGIPAEIQPHIFEPFFTTKAPGEGTGLGLSISREIVERHGGRIWLDSTTDQGATFLIELPVTPTLGPGPGEAHAEPVQWSDTCPARILVIDGERRTSYLLRKVLTRQSHHVDIAGNRAEALRRLQETPYDIVFLDLQTPDVPAQEIYDWIGEHCDGLAQRTVLLTGDTLSAEAVDLIERARTPRLGKPFRLTELRNVVKQVWPG